MASQRSFSSDHVEGGYIDRSIHLDTAEVGVQMAGDIADAITLLTDGNPSNDGQAIGILANTVKTCGNLSFTHWQAADGDRVGAKKLARNMVEMGRKKL